MKKQIRKYRMIFFILLFFLSTSFFNVLIANSDTGEIIIQNPQDLIIDGPQTIEAQVKWILEQQMNMSNFSKTINLNDLPNSKKKLSDYLMIAEYLFQVKIGKITPYQEGIPIVVREGAKKGYIDTAISILEQIYTNHPESAITMAYLGKAHLLKSSFSSRISSFVKDSQTEGAILLNRAVRRNPKNFTIQFIRFVPFTFNTKFFAGVDANEIILENYQWMYQQLNLPKIKKSIKRVSLLKNTLNILMARYKLTSSLGILTTDKQKKEILYYLNQIKNPNDFFGRLEALNFPNPKELLRLKNIFEDQKE